MNKITRERKFMNTVIGISVVRTPRLGTVKIQERIEAAFAQFDRIVKQFTRFDQSSELSNLNRRSGQWTQVSDELFALVGQMLELSKQTAGAFDPTVIDFLETYGYDPNYDFSKLDQPDLNKLVERIVHERKSWEAIELDKTHKKIKLADAQRIDLGGIGKGYAIDCAHEELRGLENFMINAGGDVRVLGENEKGEAWNISLQHLDKTNPQKQITVGKISSTDIALASSGSWARRVKQFHHLIDTRTGQPVEGLQTVFVTADTAASADGWATALFVGGNKLLEQLPEGIEAMLINSQDKATLTGKFPLEKS
jgi:thiamine biosynthesis lipoprotein